VALERLQECVAVHGVAHTGDETKGPVKWHRKGGQVGIRGGIEGKGRGELSGDGDGWGV
jgi:hypothetical protein